MNAQTKEKGAARAAVRKNNPQKAASPLKNLSIQKIARASKTGNLNTGDPCLENAPISIGQTVNGSLAATDCTLEDGSFIDFYTFNGTAGQPVSIAENSDAFDTFLVLLDDAGELIDLNDDSGATTNSRIPQDAGVVTLPYTGAYIIGANSFDPGEVGAYTLTLSTDTTACAATPINYNQTVNGTLAESDCLVGGAFFTDRYTFSGTAGQQISIDLSSTAFDTFLTMHSPSGASSVFDDDGGPGQGTDSRIPAETGTLTLTESGTYTIEASSFDAFEVGAYTVVLTGPSVTPTSNKLFDYDGDGKADLSVFRPSAATWYIRNSANPSTFGISNFGLATDTIVPADYDGDGKTDIGVFRASEGNWYSINSGTGAVAIVNFGTNGDVPVPGDFDGDDKADYAIFRPSDGSWWILQSSNGGVATVNFGSTGDKPLLGDFDGDGKSDIAIYRSSEGNWYRLNSSNGQIVITNFGLTTDIPVPADFDGDSKTDVAIFRPSEGNWWFTQSSNGSIGVVNFGANGDKPVPADYDGDGKADFAVFRPSDNTWYLQQSTAGFGAAVFGLTGDVPTPGAYVR